MPELVVQRDGGPRQHLEWGDGKGRNRFGEVGKRIGGAAGACASEFRASGAYSVKASVGNHGVRALFVRYPAELHLHLSGGFAALPLVDGAEQRVFGEICR